MEFKVTPPEMQESSQTTIHAEPPASTTTQSSPGSHLIPGAVHLILADHGPTPLTMLPPHETSQAHGWLWQEASMDMK
jgi:hypothetical protein